MKLKAMVRRAAADCRLLCRQSGPVARPLDSSGFEEYGFISGMIAELPAPLNSQMKADHQRLNQGDAMNWLFDPQSQNS